MRIRPLDRASPGGVSDKTETGASGFDELDDPFAALDDPLDGDVDDVDDGNGGQPGAGQSEADPSGTHQSERSGDGNGQQTGADGSGANGDGNAS